LSGGVPDACEAGDLLRKALRDADDGVILAPAIGGAVEAAPHSRCSARRFRL
jgi:hypothetical protein